MNKLIKSSILFLLLLSVPVHAQNDKKVQNKNERSTNKTPVNVNKESEKYLNATPNNIDLTSYRYVPDYKILSSTSSYIEIEFRPYFQPRDTIKYNGKSFDYITFRDASETNSDSPGQPDIQSRLFPIYLPSDASNVISVVDYDEHDVNGINLFPVPVYHKINPSQNNFENMVIAYEQDQKSYNKNKYYPDKIADLSVPCAFRENIIANIVLSPYQYNPVTRVLKQYTRIRVRVTFGQQPVQINRTRTPAEIELLRGAAINSDIGLNWKNPKINFLLKNPLDSNSKMSSGDWYRIEIRDNGEGASDGIYKLTKSFLESAGIDFTNVDPRTIKMYGNGGNILDTGLSTVRPYDLNEIKIFVSGDGVHFGANDYILFYGSSVNNWNYYPINGTYSHYLNVYSTSNYYWICINTPNYGQRMSVIPSDSTQNIIVPTSFTEKLFFEPEITNPLNEGNIWLSQMITNGNSIIWNNTLTGLENNTNILYKIKPASRVLSGYSNYVMISEDNSTLSPIYFPMGTVGNDFGHWIWTDTTSFVVNASQKTNGEQSSFRETFYATDPAGEGFLDWMEIQYRRRLNSVTGDFLRIVDDHTATTVEYNVSPFTNNQAMIFDVTYHNDVKIIQRVNPVNNNVKFRRSQVTLSKYFVVGQNGYKTPTGISQKFSNQNLHGISDGADFVIISYKDFIPAAQRLKLKREAPGPGSPNYLKTIIIDVQQIYNEFSGGLLDPVAIRDFLKYAYEHWSRKPSYVCFLGNGGIDYRNILTQPGTSNYIPSFEFSDPNIDQVANYSTDDFFVHVVGDYVHPLIPNFAHGRITANNLQDANNYIDKEDCYEDGNFNGYWKNKIILVADDGYTPHGFEGNIYTEQTETYLADFLPENFEIIKVYLIMYPPVITPAGRRKPSANADLIKYWNEGCIAVNWIGHGAPDIWANEYVLEKDVIVAALNNTCKYPFLSVGSCDFGKFDNPLSQCGAALLSISPKKGTIASLAATRPTYSGSNIAFISTVWNHLFWGRDTLLLQSRFGSAVILSKLSYPDDQNSLKYELFSDPTIRIQYPRFHSRVDSVAGLATDTMRALSKIKVYGSIIHPDSTFWSDYSGKIYMKIFDALKNISIYDPESNQYFTFTLPGGIIYSGTQNVKSGLWSIEFIVPKDLSYQNQNGKLINYFYNNSYDGTSVFKNFIVGGIDPNAPIDTTGPIIKLYLNSPSFRSGDVVNENFTLLADLFDASGINTTGTIGHKIEATLNNDVNNKYDLTSFYNSDSTYQSGHLSYAFSGMSPGRYNLKLKAFDTYNNFSEASIDFVVSLSSSLQVMNVFNYPNPFKDKTVFTFQHNYADPVNVRIKIYTVAGRLIKEINQYNINDKFVAINWDGVDQDGDKLSNGIYIYKLTVDNGIGNSVVNTGKLAILK
jgi:hypothetical protein